MKRLEAIVIDTRRTLASRIVALGVLERAGFAKELTKRYAFDAHEPLQETAALFYVGSLSPEALAALGANDDDVLQPWALWTLTILGRLSSGERLCDIAHDGSRSPWVHDYAVHAMMLLAERRDATSIECLRTVKSNRSWIVY